MKIKTATRNDGLSSGRRSATESTDSIIEFRST